MGSLTYFYHHNRVDVLFSINLNNIGLVYSDIGDSKKTLEYYTKALNIRKSINDKKGYTT